MNVEDDDELARTCVHEAAHVVTAHALGRRPTYVRATPVLLAANDPANPTGEPRISLGFNQSEPRRADEINARYADGLPFTPEQRDWLLGEAARQVVRELNDLVVTVPEALVERGTLEARELDELLASSPRGSHIHLLEPLREVDRRLGTY